MRFRHIAGLTAFFFSAAVFPQSDAGPASVWRFASATFGCSMNLAIREPADEVNSLSNMELSYIYAQWNPSQYFDIPLNDLRLSINFRGMKMEDELDLSFLLNGQVLAITDFSYANQLALFRASSEETQRILNAMKENDEIRIVLTIRNAGTSLERTLHGANFMNEYSLLEECLSEISPDNQVSHE